MQCLMHIWLEENMLKFNWNDLPNTAAQIAHECQSIYPKAMTELVRACLHPEPLERITTEDLYHRVESEVKKFKKGFQDFLDGEKSQDGKDNVVDEAVLGSRILLTNVLRYYNGMHREWL